jgi:hypothetical protein
LVNNTTKEKVVEDIDNVKVAIPTYPRGLDVYKIMVARTSGVSLIDRGHSSFLNNQPPNPPSQPSGQKYVIPKKVYTYCTSAIDPDGDQIYYLFDWGDGTNSGWFGPFFSGSYRCASHSWSGEQEAYAIRARAKDIHGAESDWSEPLVIIINHPPRPPSDPSPESGETGVPIDTKLSWSCSDPDNDPLTYDIYFGTVSPPPMIVSNYPYTSYKPENLKYSATYYWRIVAWDEHGASSWGGTWFFTTNTPPGKPQRPYGVTEGRVGKSYTYSTRAYDRDDHQIYYWFDWGDNTNTGWIGPYNSGQEINASHVWEKKGNYNIKVKVKDIHDAESPWSEPLAITMLKKKQLISSMLPETFLELIRRVSAMYKN